MIGIKTNKQFTFSSSSPFAGNLTILFTSLCDVPNFYFLFNALTRHKRPSSVDQQEGKNN